jgi:tetratricopeptide (TPR) repeat protein
VADWHDRLDRTQPLYIVELGAGSGRLAFHLLPELRRTLARADSVATRYVMTDVAEANLAAWRVHPQLQSWFEAGRLDLARFDAAHDRTIALERSGEILAPGRVANPVIAIANYVLDSLPTDAFSVVDGRLHEWRVRLCSTYPAELDDPELMDRLRLTCELRPVEPSGYYGDPVLDRVLDEHRAELPDTAFTFPSGPLDCLARLADLAGGRVLVLSTDKGEVAARDLRGQDGPRLTLHGSCSLTVNFHAIARWVHHRGGEALLPSVRPRTIATCGFVLGPPPGAAGSTGAAYREAIDAQRPDDLFAIQQGLEPAHAALTLEQWIGYLRFCGCDPKLAIDALPHLRALIAAGEPAPRARSELLAVLALAWDGYLHIGEPFRFGLALGELAIALGAWDEALGFLAGSLVRQGPSPDVLVQLAEVHARLGDHAAARVRLDEALALDPAHAGALALAARLAGRDAPALG